MRDKIIDTYDRVAINSERTILKYVKQDDYTLQTNKLLKDLCIKTYPKNCKSTYFETTTSTKINENKRNMIVKTLYDINYQRGDNDWAPSVIVAFMTEMFTYFVSDCVISTRVGAYKGNPIIYVHYPEDSEDYKKALENVSKRYNVPINKFKTYMAVFLNNYRKGNDTANLDKYFTKYELYSWIYRDPEKLQKDVEAKKLTEEELEIVKQLYNI